MMAVQKGKKGGGDCGSRSQWSMKEHAGLGDSDGQGREAVTETWGRGSG